MEKRIGYIGLGKMGHNMSVRLLEKGWHLVVQDPDSEAVEKVVSCGGNGASSLDQLTMELEGPRIIWLMVPHSVVDTVLEELIPLLDRGDMVIDGGNSNYEDTLRRIDTYKDSGIRFVDVGVSGGPSGARTGACLMIGGEKSDFDEIEELLQDVATTSGYAYMGGHGSGHFVKMVHNGIEYGMMQALGEGFEILKKSEFDLDMVEVARIYNTQSVIESRLTAWLHSAFIEYSKDLDGIPGSVAHSGEGLWTVNTAKKMGIKVPIIEGSLTFRDASHKSPSFTGKIVSALRNQFGGHDVKGG